jgi:hypothetical protein
MRKSDKNHDSTVIDKIEFGKPSLLDDKLLGDWTVHLSCDGSIMCYVCPKISFRADGFGSTTKSGGTVQNLKWEIDKNTLKISNFTSDNVVDNGEYLMTYGSDDNILELKLNKLKNSRCYKFTRVENNYR